MRKEKIFTVFIAAFFLFFATLTVQCTTKMQSDQTTKQTSPPTSAKTTVISGKIAIGYNNMYKIKGKIPPEVFTILNPNPMVLEEYIQSGKVVDIEVQIVSGDNIKIMTIDGKNYPKDIK